MSASNVPIHDVVVIGGGLAGLSTAYFLKKAGVESVKVLEAHASRLGGRIHTSDKVKSGDLGGAWIWPGQQSISSLCNELGVKFVAQIENEGLLFEHSPANVRRIAAGSRPAFGDGRRRLSGGAGVLIDALHKAIGVEKVILNSPVTTIDASTSDDFVRVAVATDGDGDGGGGGGEWRARSVVVAIPPRLAVKSITYTPKLENANDLGSMNTWMASTTKVAVNFEPNKDSASMPPLNARSAIGPAVEIYDSRESPADTTPRVVAFAFPEDAASSTEQAVASGVRAQFARLFPTLTISDVDVHTWHSSPFTAGKEGTRASGDGSHPHSPPSHLQRAQWSGRLRFGNSEMASHSAGLLDGAVNRAQVVASEITKQLSLES